MGGGRGPECIAAGWQEDLGETERNQEPGCRSRELRELDFSGAGWGSPAPARLLNSRGGAGEDPLSGFRPGLPVCSHPTPTFLKGPCWADPPHV